MTNAEDLALSIVHADTGKPAGCTEVEVDPVQLARFAGHDPAQGEWDHLPYCGCAFCAAPKHLTSE